MKKVLFAVAAAIVALATSNASAQTVDGTLDASGYTQIHGIGVTPSTRVWYGGAPDASQIWFAKDATNLYFFVQAGVDDSGNGVLFLLNASNVTGVTSGTALGSGGGHCFGGNGGANPNWRADFEVDYGWVGNSGGGGNNYYIDSKKYVAPISNGYSGNSGRSGAIHNDLIYSGVQHAFNNARNSGGPGNSTGWEILIPRSFLGGITNSDFIQASAIVVSSSAYFSNDSTDGLLTSVGDFDFNFASRAGIRNSTLQQVPVSMSSFSIE